MKKSIFISLIVLAGVISACSSRQASYTPYILHSSFYLNPVYRGDSIVAAQDTLDSVAVSPLDGYYHLKPIHVGDTVVFVAGFGSVANDLIAARMNVDTLSLIPSAQMGDDFRAILLPESDTKHVQLLFKPGYSFAALRVGYRPIKTGEHTIELVVESDSKFSPKSQIFKQPVIE